MATKFFLSFLGAVSMLAGLTIQGGSKNNRMYEIIGASLFTFGLVMLTYSVGEWNPFIWLVSILILVSYFMNNIPFLIIGWLLFAYLSSAKGSYIKIGISFVSIAFFLFSTLYLLPRQRENCVVDGAGYPLLTLSLCSIAVANAL